ncbi:MAG: aldo/keto reductase [Myxococcales bacterium]|nr:aldo/keto reductase [Myxococcales bacterium]
MEPRPLGASGLFVSPVIYGAQAFARQDPAERVRTLHAAIEAGITSIDTAPLYEFGESERLVGQAIAGRRDAVQILGKVGLRWDDDHGDVMLTTTLGDGSTRVVRRDSRPIAVRRDVEQSLRRLGVDALDLCQVHHPDARVPIADTMGELLRLRDEGKLRAIGVSNFSAEQVEQAQAALGDVPLASVQSEYSLLRREVERELLDVVLHHGVGFLAYSPLLHGLLAGCMAGRRRLSLEDHRRWNPVFHPVNVARVEEARKRGLESLARRHGVSSAQIALAWVLHQPGVTGVIVGGSSPAQVRGNARAAELVLRAGERSGLAAELEQVRLDLELAPRRRDKLRDRAERLERLAERAWRAAERRLPWLPAWPWQP